MKTIEFKPDGKSTIISPGDISAYACARNEILIETLPYIFHKLKNKLTPILGYTQILISRTGDEFIKDRLARIERNTVELTESLNTLKEYCKATADRRGPADLNHILEDLAPRWQEISRDAGVRIVLELDPALPLLSLDPDRMRILLLSMADNAVNALKAKPAAQREIRVSTRNQGRSTALVVRDNGCGISNEEVMNIWVPFFSRFPGHAGLGLVLCEKIIADHGAACTVVSVPGESSEFTITFPQQGNS